MSGYHDMPYELQDALKAYLSGKLSGKTALPIVTGANFEGRDDDHIYIAVPRMTTPWNRISAEVVIGVGTLRDTSTEEHREYCKAVFDAILSDDFIANFNATSSRVKLNQGDQPAGGLTSGVTEHLRFLELSREYLIYAA